MALKGTTVIELTNIKTGEIERYEDQNMTTQALSQLHESIGNLKMATDCLSASDMSSVDRAYKTYEPLYPLWLGGMVLWNEQIDENETTILQPKSIKMVGCAAYGSTNSTTSDCRGNYNSAESYFTDSSVETSMKFVYDFATNQANGMINSVSLTSLAGGWNGFGGNEKANDFIGSKGVFGSSFGCWVTRPYKFFYSSAYKVIYIDPDEDVFFEVGSLSTTTLKIYKCRANIHQRSVFKNMYQDHELLDTINISLPTTLSGTDTWLVKYDSDNNLLYVIVSPSSSSIASNGTFYVISVDMSNYETIVYTMTNKTGSTINAYSESMACYDGYIYYNYSSAYVRKIKMDDSSYISIDNPTGVSNGGYSYPMVFNGMVYYFAGYTYISGNSTRTSNVVACIDTKTNEAVATGFSGFGSYHLVPIKGHPMLYYSSNSSTRDDSVTYYYGGLFLIPLYLATINNLSRPIEKTSDKTMKITYTIQEV